MGWFRKNPDVISGRTRVLNDEIARLEYQIKKLDSRLQRSESQPRLRSTALPHGTNTNRAAPLEHGALPPAPGAAQEPIFEEVDQEQLKTRDEPGNSQEHFNQLGVRKYDLPALLRRLRDQFRGPSTTNPKLVSYLAAGGLQGLRPLRYEKRIARNRFFALVLVLFLTLLGIIFVFHPW